MGWRGVAYGGSNPTIAILLFSVIFKLVFLCRGAEPQHTVVRLSVCHSVFYISFATHAER